MPDLYTYCSLCQTEFHVPPFYLGKIANCSHCKNIIHLSTIEGKSSRAPQFKIQTERLLLDLATRKQWKGIHVVQSDPKNFRYEIAKPHTEKDTKAKLKAFTYPRGLTTRLTLQYYIATREEGTIIGVLSVHFDRPFYTASIGIMFHHPYHGQGYGTEALAAVTSLLINHLHLEKITIMCDSANMACRRIMEKTGYTQETLHRKHHFRHGEGWVDAAVYTLYREQPENSLTTATVAELASASVE